MWLSIEAYLLVNLLMDALLIALALRAAGRPVTAKVWPAALFGAAYACLCAICRIGWLRSLPMQGIAMLTMLKMAAGRKSISFRLIAAMAMETLLMGGLLEIVLARWPGLAGFLGAAALGCVLISSTQDRRRVDLPALTVCVEIRAGEKHARFDALIDTGNRLQEPFTGLPVLIAEAHLVADILPETGLPLRRIPYGGLGGSGFLEAFRPEEMRFSCRNGWRKAPESWVALYPGKMSGQVHALAPAAFALSDVENSRWIREERL